MSGKLAINETGVNVSVYNRDDLWRMRADALRGIIPIGNRWQEEMGKRKSQSIDETTDWLSILVGMRRLERPTPTLAGAKVMLFFNIRANN